ncbi:oligopeptide transport system permease protein [Friedmanniella endophytica]|uniref:Oligopeptide transport system permease protein n=1 Tax=Microlunatus kandeliicorticis TaxID=1759536 RepID=A0A7W3ISN5_9ACTN|nr:ABC transporter permease [Microlunatus kandeliicorticis]MBA8794511.1 oligopeptide transport system permease protein [Microlunatus kandeliicorticis]
MVSYTIRRILQMIPVLLGATFILFAAVFALGDPSAGRCGQRPCPPGYIAKFRAEYHLDQPLLVQYGYYLGKLFRGDLGTSFYGNPVAHELAIRYPTTIKLTVIAILCEVIIGVAAGVLAGIRKGRFLDNLVLISTLLVISIPVFVIGNLAQLVFGVKLEWFPPTAGQGSLYELLLPGFVLGALSVAYISRLTRNSVVENLRTDYVRTARAKGLSNARVISVHTLRNSLIPVVTFIGTDIGSLMGGAIVTERIFNVNGIGNFIFRSINQKDGQSVVGAVLILVVVYLVMNLIVDLLYGVLDPRISND